jgi:hypothetical protein
MTCRNIPETIRTVLLLLVILFLASAVKAADPVEEVPISNIGSPFCVSVAPTSWTKFGPTYALSKRTGIIIRNPSDGSANLLGVLGRTSPSVSTTTASIEIEPGENPLRPVGPNVNLYLVNDTGSAVTVCGQEVRQAF